jgi:hypothetical protein
MLDSPTLSSLWYLMAQIGSRNGDMARPRPCALNVVVSSALRADIVYRRLGNNVENRGGRKSCLVPEQFSMPHPLEILEPISAVEGRMRDASIMQDDIIYRYRRLNKPQAVSTTIQS